MTAVKWITGEIFGTRARRGMMDYVANSAESARAKTWITAFFVHACSIARTIGIYGALWSTIRRTAHVIWQTGTRRRTSDITAL